MVSNSANRIDCNSVQIERALDGLKPSARGIKASFKSGARKSLNIIRSSVKKGAATVTSNREKVNKGVSTKMYKRTFGGSVGINRSFTLSDGHWFGLFLLELGTSDTIGRTGKRHGATPAKPFFVNAVRSSMSKAKDTLNDNILQAIERKAAKERAKASVR